MVKRVKDILDDVEFELAILSIRDLKESENIYTVSPFQKQFNQKLIEKKKR